ncbi:MAG: hypothetical protein V7746_19940 [Halioglobus sp.]
MKRVFYLVFLSLISGCSRIDSLLMEPKTTGAEWCQGMPCVELLSSGVVLNQPYSTLLVYLLGILWIWAGLRFWKTRDGQVSKIWWCASLVLGGIAALSAGTSYQAFGYELKCAGREFCAWTTWWEIAYMTLQVSSLNAMLIAVAYSCTQKNARRALIAYAWVNFLSHFMITMAGAITLKKFMLSFELVVLFTTPTLFAFFVINGWRYFKYKQAIDLVLLGSWTILLLTNVFYFAYLSLGYTQVLWEQGVWFSENDVLHVLVMIWLVYVGLLVSKEIQDYGVPGTAEDLAGDETI